MQTKPSCFESTNASGAFTLIEIMVVVVLIAILTAMIIPEMKGTFEDTLLRSNARELVNVVELASSRAVSLNQTLRVKIDPGTGDYEVEKKQRQGLIEDFAPLEDVSGSKGKLDKRITVQVYETPETQPEPGAESEASLPMPSPDSTLTFYSDGTADGAMVLLKDRSGFQLPLRLNAITSRVTIGEPKHE
ncbi:MAG TPA: GspH/FimT family pseudopilin [Verrucomicrobiae bacterium]|jgi:type II secretion system protein H|nr:GspH/FimT family pseudopilin [Verrucomicrobiae bacterium]